MTAWGHYEDNDLDGRTGMEGYCVKAVKHSCL